MESIGVGILGFGLSATMFHIPFLKTLPQFKIQAVATQQKEKAQKMLPDAAIYQTTEECVNDPNVQLVIVATPNHLHQVHAIEALGAKKHVVVEKPFGLNVGEVDIMVALAQKQNVLLTCFHNRRWDGDFLTIKKAIQSGVIGDVYSYEMRFDRYRPEVQERWKEDGTVGSGTLYNLAPHMLDQVIHLFGMPTSMNCDLDTQRKGAKSCDYFHYLLTYDKTKIVLSASNLVQKEDNPRYQIHGSKGSLFVYGRDGQEGLLHQEITPHTKEWKPTDAFEVEFFDGKKTKALKKEEGSYQTFYKELYKALQGEAPLPIDPEDAIKTIFLIEESIKEYL